MCLVVKVKAAGSARAMNKWEKALLLTGFVAFLILTALNLLDRLHFHVTRPKLDPVELMRLQGEEREQFFARMEEKYTERRERIAR